MPTTAEILIEKIQILPTEHVAEVANFVEFLQLKEQDHQLVRAAAQASAPAIAAAWDNTEGEAYDAL